MRALLALLIGAASAVADEAPRIRSLEASGVSAYSQAQLQEILRLAPGAALLRTPEDVARTLESRYRIDGFPAARVRGSFDAGSGALRLEVDEGRLVEVTAKGLSPAAAERAVRSANLETGRVLREGDVWGAYDRLEETSGGALLRGDYRVEETPEGARLVLEPQARAAEVGVSIAAFAGAGRKNRVDDWTQPLGVELTLFDRTHYNHTRLYARAAYATGPDDWRWHLGVQRPFFAKDRLVLGYEHHDVTDSDDVWRGAGTDEAWGESIWTDTFSRYYARRGDEAFALYRAGGRFHAGVSYRRDRYASLPVVTGADQANPAVDEGRMSSLIGTLRYATGAELSDEPAHERESFLLRSLYGLATTPPRALRVELGLELADADSLGGDFTFKRFIASLRGRLFLGTQHQLDGRALLGLGDERLPAQKRFVLGGIGTLRGHPYAAFEGESFVLVTGEYGFEVGHGLPRLLAFYDGGSTWSEGISGPGFKSGIGAGLRWPASGGAFLRLEFARALDDELADKTRTLFRVQLPF
ncbi:MAG TPA: BamA/TamA family outer membrane protein [Vicinamibacteria bacterium]|nr:BamA/TamA family outer membrane protein [Vicinamibacteria bacterium]